MSKASENANAVAYAIEQVCGLYGVEILRMQSRVFTVPGAAGRSRPMFIGQWKDQFGNKHNSGMADFLARPRVPATDLLDVRGSLEIGIRRVTVPLWIEAKSGKGALSDDQIAFKSYVEGNGEFWLVIHDDVRPLIEWFELRGVKK